MVRNKARGGCAFGIVVGITALMLMAGGAGATTIVVDDSGQMRFLTTGITASPNGTASDYLATVMDQFHSTFNVYTDADAAGNHFAARGRMSSQGDEDAVLPMDEASVDNPHSGITSIKATFKSRGQNWGGWYFMNGVLQGNETAPRPNWGDYANSGVDLQGATKLTFWSRGARGGERVEFIAFGIGRNRATGAPIKPHPDSSPTVSTGYVTLSSEWKQYPINLSGDLSYVLGGFGWVTNAPQNGYQDITFYIDDIQYDKPRLNESRFLVSYETINSTNDFDVVMRNVAFTYDNAVALLAFLASGEKERAKLIADALVYAQQHDRFYNDGRIRNAYQGGDLVLPPGWLPNWRENTVRMPGWYNATKKQWFEDRFQVSTHTGNVAWSMLALLAYYETEGGDQYLAAAERMGDWVESNTHDTRGAGGYTGGFEGWEPNPTKLLYKSTEHNIDLYAAFQRLYRITANATWRERADHAKQFVLSMWDENERKFWTGTDNSGVSINKEVVPLDIQAWALLSLKYENSPYLEALDYAETHHKVGSGFDFNTDLDGIWYEGTGQMAVAFQQTEQLSKGQAVVDFLKSAQLQSGGLYAADKDGLTTGFNLSDGQPWLYFRRVHVGATSWLVLAEKNANPFWMGSKDNVGSGFDTGAGSYPSIMGTHNGTLRLTQSINVSKMYTYPSPGTGGHSEYVKIYNNSWSIEANWSGYMSDWRNITLSQQPFTLEAGEYNYTIKTGSYPQIIHKQNHTTPDGSTITSTEFIDANGRRYIDWIPAISLE